MDTRPAARTGRTSRHDRPSSVPARLFAILAALLLALTVAAPVAADAELDRSEPEDGEVLATPPTEVTLRFTAGLDAGKSSVRLLGPDGDTEVARGTPAEDGAKTMRIEDLALVPGVYTVRWTSAALDGHLVRGRFTFTVSEPTPAPATPTPTPTEAPSIAESAAPSPPATAAPTSPTPTASADQSPAAASGGDVLVPIVAALALVGVVGFLVLRRNRAA
ncbi:MAG TPA: copper resistance CopC family protein [Candidatus Limnocylindrales bacterium]|nr:copper resistance CopC family protein [Candidatus Limnocylindrales bacterium]